MEWSITFDGETVSFFPSIGELELPGPIALLDQGQ
jgi:hypothetical protein